MVVKKSLLQTRRRFWEGFRIQNIGEHHDLYVQRDTLFLADVFESF